MDESISDNDNSDITIINDDYAEVTRKGRFARRRKNLDKKNLNEIDLDTGMPFGVGNIKNQSISFVE